MTTAPATKRILKLWDSATPEQLAEGLAWYHRANHLAVMLSGKTRFTIPQVAGVIAALSPRSNWTANQRGAHTMVLAAHAGFRQPAVAGFPANRDKAWRILTELPEDMADDVDLILYHYLGGPKVRSFFLNILGFEDPVTVDMWAATAALGDFPTGSNITDKQYRTIAASYRNAAKLRGVTPRDMQAAVWVNIRAQNSDQLWLFNKEFV